MARATLGFSRVACARTRDMVQVLRETITRVKGRSFGGYD